MISLNESSKEVNNFLKGDTFFPDKGSPEKLKQLENEKSIRFPEELNEYINTFVSNKNIFFATVGNAKQLYSDNELSWTMQGYNYNPVINEVIDDWDSSWFLIGDEGGDPIIIKLNENERYSNVYTAMHGSGNWEFEQIADSIGQFILCSAAVHKALTGYDVEDSIIDDDAGFNLVEEPASFLFPFIKKTAPKYYEYWVSVFDNS